MVKYIKPEMIFLKGNPDLNEKWVQKVIADDPSILGLGEVILKDAERVQPSGGRLDLLLYDPEANRRYEVELQLGLTDESHIIRTIEYWDYERRRYPQYEHCAVLIAEDITSRFLNVIALFNGMIPIIAIQLKAFKLGDGVSLIFSTVVDVLSLGTEEEDKGETVDRKYWESRATKESVRMVDKLLELTGDFAPRLLTQIQQILYRSCEPRYFAEFCLIRATKKYRYFVSKTQRGRSGAEMLR